ncbi:hypothetical protein AMATHDRAFT_9801 [Amanita thiersii Skay4041]|uniref:Uncharacterized protein n=1 Tax=Amanita thiersii Skay4041 TaxID=703135 RepID=A0A2A9N882_9AGAR|nr:hypothetical protein AMATHDRAFT_9801 [Amanita thiersii Skay4041]
MQLKTLTVVLVLGVAPILSHPLYPRQSDPNNYGSSLRGSQSGMEESSLTPNNKYQKNWLSSKITKAYEQASESISGTGDKIKDKSRNMMDKAHDRTQGLKKATSERFDNMADDFADKYRDARTRVKITKEDIFGSKSKRTRRDLERLRARGNKYDDYYDLD